ncbi:hypothetical protein EST38_g9956 [Candolleomyces aberdarensis]|uniref:Uncharacterized protein n=1 Tax=Candolleomyces aberdarensis TaxID=2316362 RepID=A0A4Q2DBI0_9AGAR|nr:hypothetical protein EST38_g9956 [Candolleomyces aberdarensis]
MMIPVAIDILRASTRLQGDAFQPNAIEQTIFLIKNTVEIFHPSKNRQQSSKDPSDSCGESDDELRPMIGKITLNSFQSFSSRDTDIQEVNASGDVEMDERGQGPEETEQPVNHGPAGAQTTEGSRASELPPLQAFTSSSNDTGENQDVTISTPHLRLVIDKLTVLSDGLDSVSGTLSEQYSSLMARVQDLENKVLSSTPEVPTLGARKENKKPYKRRTKADIELSAKVRDHLDTLLDAYEDPFVDEDAAEEFEQDSKDSPEIRCCGTHNFQIDVTGGPHSAWNTSAALVFAESYLQTKGLPEADAPAVMQAFFTRVKSIKQERCQTPKKRLKKATYLRKYTRRLDIGRQRGNWPRPRIYDPLSPRFSSRTEFPKNLPKNAYDAKWLATFPNVPLSVNPGPEYDLVHPPEVFHFLVTQNITHPSAS